MADYATLLWELKEELGDPEVPVIGFGGYALAAAACSCCIAPLPAAPRPLGALSGAAIAELQRRLLGGEAGGADLPALLQELWRHAGHLVPHEVPAHDGWHDRRVG